MFLTSRFQFWYSSVYFLLVCNFRSCPGENWNLSPYTKGKGRLKKEAGFPKWVGDRFSKKGNLHVRLILGSYKTGRSLHLPAKILKVHLEALIRFSHTYHQVVSTTHCALKVASLKAPSDVGMVGRTYIPRTGRRVRALSLWWPRSISQVNWQSSPLKTSSNTFFCSSMVCAEFHNLTRERTHPMANIIKFVTWLIVCKAVILKIFIQEWFYLMLFIN